jgi:hypothetical protein
MMRILPLLVFLLSGISFSEVLFTDDFNDGDDAGWTCSGTAGFTVLQGEYFIHSQSTRGQGKSSNGDVSGVMSTSDYSVLCTIELECGTEAGVAARFEGADQWYYRAVIKPNSGYIQLERKKDSGLTVIMCQYPMSLGYNIKYWIRLQVEGNLIRARLWTGTLENEPAIWQLEDSDSAQQNPGSFSLFAGGYGKSFVSWSSIFDDVSVSTPIEQSLEQVTWASLKQSVNGIE